MHRVDNLERLDVSVLLVVYGNKMDLDERIILQAINNWEEMENYVENAGFRREYNRRLYNPFTIPDNKFIRLFRLTKALARDLINIVSNYIDAPRRASALDVQTKVFAALCFFATGSYQMDAATKKYINISQSSVSRAIHEVRDALNNPAVFEQWVKFPRNIGELDHLRDEFFNLYGFPGVIGCIDCTHVAIVPPKSNDEVYPEHIYVNRKNYHSINCQLVCDTHLKILNCNGRYPGSTHDGFIWANSNVKRTMINLHQRGLTGYWLLGDSGYALRPYLLTPLENALPDTPEDRYNHAKKSTRSLIERCNGLLKMRFRYLLKHRFLHYTPHVASRIINACCVLHNMCIAYNVPEPDAEEGDENLEFGLMDGVFDAIDVNNGGDGAVNRELEAARRLQQRIMRNYFA